MSIEAKLASLVLAEARLLDEWKLDDWLALFATDAVYWIPIDENADPRLAGSIMHETHEILKIRVEQLMRDRRHAQSPRSEVMRNISNLDIAVGEGGDVALARYNLLAIELRSGDWRQLGLGDKRFFAGRATLNLKRDGDGWKIAGKTIVLLDRRQPIEGLSFIL